MPAGQAANDGAVDDSTVPVAPGTGPGGGFRVERGSIEPELLDDLVQPVPDGLLFREPIEALGGRIDGRDQAACVGRNDAVGHLLDDDTSDAGRSDQALAEFGRAVDLQASGGSAYR